MTTSYNEPTPSEHLYRDNLDGINTTWNKLGRRVKARLRAEMTVDFNEAQLTTGLLEWNASTRDVLEALADVVRVEIAALPPVKKALKSAN